MLSDVCFLSKSIPRTVQGVLTERRDRGICDTVEPLKDALEIGLGSQGEPHAHTHDCCSVPLGSSLSSFQCTTLSYGWTRVCSLFGSRTSKASWSSPCLMTPVRYGLQAAGAGRGGGLENQDLTVLRSVPDLPTSSCFQDKSMAILEKWKLTLESSGIHVIIGGHNAPSPRGGQ